MLQKKLEAHFYFYHLRRWGLAILITLLSITGCGFHLRGAFSIPPSLQTLHLQPYQPYDPFQRSLRQILKSNQVKITDDTTKIKETTVLRIITHNLSERTIAYGSDGQPNRALLQLTVVYQIIDPTNQITAEERTAEVERELTLNPNQVLGTDSERSRLNTDLYLDAALQLVRQLSAL